MGAEDKMKLSKLAKAAIFGFCYYLILNLYLFLALAMKAAHTGILANKSFQGVMYGLGLPLTLPFTVFSYKYRWLANYSLVLNALVWGLAFYAILLLREWRRKPDSGKGSTSD
jgi:hypothetical protein